MAPRAATYAAPLALLLVLACSDTVPTSPPPLDRFYYPTGLAIRHEPPGCVGGSAGCQTQLLVVSSNFDLRFDPALGGTILNIDVERALTGYNPALPPQALRPVADGGALLGEQRIGSFGGEIAILDEESCPGWRSTPGNPLPQALVASRSQNTLARVSIDPAGGLACDGCEVPLDRTLGDPYGVTVACRGTTPDGSAPPAEAVAFVTYLRTPSSSGRLSRVDLSADPASLTQIDLGTNDPAHSTVFDRIASRLYVTHRFATVGIAPLRWLSLLTPLTPENTVVKDFFSLIRGAEVRGMAISSDGARAYLTIRIYDADLAATAGVRPIDDVAGALVVMDLTEGPGGQPSGRILDVVPIDRGATEVRTIARLGPPARRDLVAVTCTDDSTLVLYDDQTGAVANVLDVCGGTPGVTAPEPCAPGKPLLGKQPFGLATETISAERVRLYVGSFDRAWVNVIEINPLLPSAPPASWARIGPER